MSLEDERERLGEGGVGDSGQKGVVDLVQGERLLDVVPHLVDGDVVSLVVHPFLLDAGAEVRLEPALGGAGSVPRPARGMDDDVVCDGIRFLLREAQLLEKVRNVLLVRFGRGVFLADDLVELRLAVLAALLEAGVPDVEWLERPTEPLLDRLRDARDERGRQDVFEHLADSSLGKLAVLVETPRDERGGGLARRLEVRAQHRVAGVGLRRVRRFRRGLGGRRGRRRIGVLLGRRADLVRERVPVDVRVVDDGLRDRLRDDPLHHLLDRPLLREAVRRVAVVRLDLVAQVPVRKEPHLRREKAVAAVVDEVVHPDVVLRDVRRRLGRRLRDRQVDGRRDALGKALRESGLRPLPPRPPFSFGEPLLERGQGKVQQDDERELVREEIVVDVRGGTPSVEDLIEGIDRAEVEIDLPAEVARDLDEVAVDRFEDELQPVEERVERLLLGGEVDGGELVEVAVFLAPELRHLREAS